jgi:SAM-dependent methyltransferase
VAPDYDTPRMCPEDGPAAAARMAMRAALTNTDPCATTGRHADVATPPAAACHVGGAHAADRANQVGVALLRFADLLRPGAHILDAGTGPDRDLARLLALGHRPVSVDLNSALPAEDARHGFRLGGRWVLPFKACHFDGIWARASLMHLPTGEAKAALGELFRVAAPGAQVCASVKITGRPGWAETPRGRRWFQLWEPASFAAAVRAAGFTVSSVEPGPVFVDVWATA